MMAYWPPGTCGGPSWQVRDNRHRQGSTPSANRGYSIEMFFPAYEASGRAPFANFVDALIKMVNAATTTFLAGYVSLRFTGATEAYLGMQQWNQTCSVEVSTLPGVQGELALLGSMLDLMYEHGGLPHWGQLIDLNLQGYGTTEGHGSLYPRYADWRRVYAKMSNNLTARTFENALSRRWNLTSYEQLAELHVVGVTDLGGMFHTIRHPNSWHAFGNVKTETGDPGKFVAVGCGEVNGELHVVGVTDTGGMFHTIRQPNSWLPFGNVKAVLGDPSRFVAVGCGEVNRELHVVGVTDTDGMFHTIRHPNRWLPFGNVKTVVSDPGKFVATASPSSALS